MKRYFVRPNYWLDWSIERSEDALVSEEAISDMARKKSSTVDALMNQLIENPSDALVLSAQINHDLYTFSNDGWDMDLLGRFCKLAGLDEEWANATEHDFMQVVFKAANILDVGAILGNW